MLLFYIFNFFSLIHYFPTSSSAHYHPLSEAYIRWINENQSHWKAGKNFDTSEWFRVKNMASGKYVVKPKWLFASKLDFLLGVLRQSLLKKEHSFKTNTLVDDSNIPAYFDARNAWPKCKSIRQIWDQSHCGSCWVRNVKIWRKLFNSNFSFYRPLVQQQPCLIDSVYIQVRNYKSTFLQKICCLAVGNAEKVVLEVKFQELGGTGKPMVIIITFFLLIW